MGALVRAVQDPRAHPRAGGPGHRRHRRAGQGQRRREPAGGTSFKVQSIPAVFAVVDGKVVDGFIGAPDAQVAEFVQRLAPPPSEADLLAAAGDEASLRQALELEPDHVAALAALARILIDRGEPAEALALLAGSPRPRPALPGGGSPTGRVQRPGRRRCRRTPRRAARAGAATTRRPDRSSSTCSRRSAQTTRGTRATARRFPNRRRPHRPNPLREQSPPHPRQPKRSSPCPSATPSDRAVQVVVTARATAWVRWRQTARPACDRSLSPTKPDLFRLTARCGYSPATPAE